MTISDIHKKAVYIGAGLDVMPYICLNDITTFVAIDSEPLFGQGLKRQTRKNIYCVKWLDKLIYKMTTIGYHIDSEDINLIVFKNDLNQSVRYYYNIIFPDLVNYNIRNELSNVNVIIDIGHHAHTKLLNLLPLKYDLICSTKTSYLIDDYVENNIFEQGINLLKKNALNWYLIIDDFEYDYEFKKDTDIKVIKLSGYDELINYKKKDVLSKL